MTYQFTAALVRSLGGRVREVRLDRIVEGAYAATVSVEGPQGVALVDARSSDALARRLDPGCCRRDDQAPPSTSNTQWPVR
jgi:bifunctional DNase/RNase